MKLSENFSVSEFLKSNVAERKGIDNTPTKEHIEQLQLLVTHILQPLRDCIGPIRVNSGYRSKALNKAIGGAHKVRDGVYIPTSQHCKGQAADLGLGSGENRIIWDEIQNLDLPFDQLIWEFGDAHPTGNPRWIHVSYNPKGGRKQLLEAYGSNGRTKYRTPKEIKSL